MFDSGHILNNQSDMESKEHGNDNQHAEIHQIANDCEIIGVERSFKSTIKDENDIVEPGWQVVDKDLSH